jgi:hypothetical protein
MTDWDCDRLGLAFIPPASHGATAYRIVQRQGPRRMPQHQHLVVTGARGLGVAGYFLDELHAGGHPEFGVDVRQVGVHGPR